MIKKQATLRDPAWTVVLEEEALQGSELPLRIRAADRLRSLGKAPDHAMLADWQALLGDWEKYSGRAYDNGAFDLLAYLLASDDASIPEQATRDFPAFTLGRLNRMFEGLARVYKYSPFDREQPQSPVVQARVEKIFASFLHDERESWVDARSCRTIGDWAAGHLAQLNPSRYSADAGATYTARAAARLRTLNAWRASENLPALPELPSPLVAREDRNTIAEVAFADSHLDGTPLHKEIENLRGQKLAPDSLVRLLCDFSAHMPEGVSGLCIRAVRAPGGSVTVKVWSELGSTDPAKRFAWTTMAVSQAGKNVGVDSGVPHDSAAAHPEFWRGFTRALTKGLGGAPDTELIARIGLQHSDRD